jgi:hypothetical protein
MEYGHSPRCIWQALGDRTRRWHQAKTDGCKRMRRVPTVGSAGPSRREALSQDQDKGIKLFASGPHTDTQESRW